MRTSDEIVAEITRLGQSNEDFFSYRRTDLISTLPYEAAKPFIKDSTSAEKWNAAIYAPDDDTSIKRITEYMPFAWEKANHCRGLSAGRSINHMQAWLWLLGEDEVVAQLNDYELYGKPQLRAICEHFGLPWQEWDSGEWVADEDGPPREKYAADLKFKEKPNGA